jgi:hypothetical protein
MTISEVLSDKTKWTKGANARDVNDNEISVNNIKAVKWCLGGAATKCGNLSMLNHWFVRNHPCTTVSLFNDYNTYKIIMRLVREFELDIASSADSTLKEYETSEKASST